LPAHGDWRRKGEGGTRKRGAHDPCACGRDRPGRLPPCAGSRPAHP